jgi:hypothetical protein
VIELEIGECGIGYTQDAMRIGVEEIERFGDATQTETHVTEENTSERDWAAEIHSVTEPVLQCARD